MQRVLNIVSDVATPHNNCLVAALRARKDLKVFTWYAHRSVAILPWKDELGGDTDNFYFDTLPNRLRLLRKAVFGSDEDFLLVGYSNNVSRLILGAFWLLHRDLMYWSDHPKEVGSSRMRRWLRCIGYAVLKTRARTVFVVGQHTVEWFKGNGFPADKLVNLPVFIDLPDLDHRDGDVQVMRERFGIAPGQMFFFAASRLTFEKGYDLLIRAIGLVPPEQRNCLKLVIVGAGPAESELKALVRRDGLEQAISFENWLGPQEYARAISAADVFVHPARFDAFGGGTLFAMAAGVPVIGSDGAGTVLERVVSGENGFVYPKEDVEALATRILEALRDPQRMREMGKRARETAEQWPPSRGAAIICEEMQRNSNG